MKLFEIGSELMALHALLEENGGDISDPQVEQAITEWYSKIADDEGNKVDAMYGICRTLEMEAAVATAEAEQFAAKARARTNAGNRLKDRLKLYLEMTGRKEVVGASGRKAAIQNNGGKVGLKLDPVVEHHPEKLPVEYQRVRVEPNNDAIRTDLEAGKALEFARLEPRGTHLRWR